MPDPERHRQKPRPSNAEERGTDKFKIPQSPGHPSTREVTARKERLGGRAQISIKSYPRITYTIAVEIDRCVDFRSVNLSSDLGRVLAAALDPSDLQVSQEIGRYLINKGAQGAVVPSVVAPGANVIVFLDANPAPKIEIANRKEILQAIEDLARRIKK